MNDRMRKSIFFIGAVVLLSLLAWGMGGLPPFGSAHERLGLALLAAAPAQRHALAVVTAINFDFRGIDTLGEEFILYAAVAGVALLLRTTRREEKEGLADESRRETLEQEEEQSKTLPEAGDAIRAFAYFLGPMTLFFGLYLVLLAHLSLGGGFQGGVVLATAWLLIYLAGGDAQFHRFAPKRRAEVLDALGAGGYAVIGFVALFSGAAFLQNVLPLGKTGHINSAGTIPVINFAVAIAVAAGFVLLFREFVKGWEQRKVLEKP